MKIGFHLLIFCFYTISFSTSACDLFQCTYSKVGAGIGVSNHAKSSLSAFQLGVGMSINNDYYVGIDALSFWDSNNIEKIGAELYLKDNYEVNNDAQLYWSGGVSSFDGIVTLGAGLLYSISGKYAVDVGYKFYPSFSDSLEDLFLLNIGLLYDFSQKDERSNNIDLMSRPSSYVENRTTDAHIATRKDEAIKITRYIVKQGDCLLCIAAEQKVAISSLRAMNFWIDDLYQKGKENLIFPGQEINFDL